MISKLKTKKQDLKKKWNLKNPYYKKSSQKSRKMCNKCVDCSRRTTNSQYFYEKILNFTNSQGDKYQNNLHKLKCVLYLLLWRVSSEVKEDKGHFNALQVKCKRFQPFLESTLITFIAFLNINTVQWEILFQRLHLTEIRAPVTQPRIAALFLETKTQEKR